jgi:hypothetical membrane protein
MALSALNKAGALLFVGVAQFSVMLIVAEAFYPGYTISNNYISDLAAKCDSTCIFIQPSSAIFDGSIVLLGILLLATAYFLYRSGRNRPLTFCITLAGIGCIGVGTPFFIFTSVASAKTLHTIFSFITFVFIGFSAISAYTVQRAPMRYLSVLAGIATLIALVLFASKIYLGLGYGGMERMIVYPVMVWAIGFGGHLMGLEEKSASKSTQM